MRSVRPTVVALVVLLLAACSPANNTARPAPPTSEQPRPGGTLVIGASADPACADWYLPCGASFWGLRALGLQTLPTPVEFVDNQYRTSALLASDPRVDPGPPQRVTYHINPAAVWSDGVPITSADFKYSWEQGKATNFRATADIADVDDSDPATAVVTFTQATASWRDRFRPILPKHLLQGKDRNTELKDGYRFSGGPWILDHWTRGQEIRLVRNPRYWGKPANLDAVVFRIIPDSAAYIQAYKAGQVDMIYLPAAPEAAELKDLPNTAYDVDPSLTYAYVTFNTQRAPLDSRAVRQALAYATDREAIVKQLFGSLQPDIRPADAVMSPANREWYVEPFARYRRDLAKVNDLMRADGWTRPAGGVWAKADTPAKVEIKMGPGQKVNDLTAQILQSQWKEAGFDVSIVTSSAASAEATRGNFSVGLGSWAAGSTDPELCAFFCSANIPTEANGFQGMNASRIASPALDDAWQRVNAELDPAKRKELVRRGQELLADEVPVLPLAGLPVAYAASASKVGGPLTSNPAFLRLSDWFCKSACG